MGVPKVATVWFEACSGCHMSFLDLDEDLVSILSKIELTFTPITDFKDYAFPELDVGIIEGGIGNEEHWRWPKISESTARSWWPGGIVRCSEASIRCATGFPRPRFCEEAMWRRKAPWTV